MQKHKETTSLVSNPHLNFIISSAIVLTGFPLLQLTLFPFQGVKHISRVKTEQLAQLRTPRNNNRTGRGMKQRFSEPWRGQIWQRGQCSARPHTILTPTRPCWTASADFPGILRSSACWALSSAAGNGQPQRECRAQSLARSGTGLLFQVFWGEMTMEKYECPSIPPDHIWLKFHNGSADYGQYIQSLLTNDPAGWASAASGMCGWIHCSLQRADSFETHLCLFLLIPCSRTLPGRSSACKQPPLPVKQSPTPAPKSSCCWERGALQKLNWKSCCWKTRNKELPWHPPCLLAKVKLKEEKHLKWCHLQGESTKNKGADYSQSSKKKQLKMV